MPTKEVSSVAAQAVMGNAEAESRSGREDMPPPDDRMMDMGGDGMDGRAESAGHPLDDVLQFMDEDVPVVRRAAEMASAAYAEDGRPSSDEPELYTSAVSMKVPPASMKVSRMRWEVAVSASAPKVIVPRAWAETTVPLFPSVRYSIVRR